MLNDLQFNTFKIHVMYMGECDTPNINIKRDPIL